MKFLVADDHYLIREGIRYALERAFPALIVVEAAAGDEVVTLAATQPDLDLILLDYYMPATSSDELIAWLLCELPHVPLVVLSAADDPVLIRRLLNRGVTGFLSKSAGPEMIIDVVRRVLAGEFVAPAIDDSLDSAAPPPQAPPRDLLPRLTHRQRQVLTLMLQGRTNKDISRELHISENTIKVHVTAVLKVLGVANRIQAVLAAQRLGLISFD